jgi:hypothetical protein
VEKKRLNAEDIHKEILPVYCGKCFSLKAVHNWAETFSQVRSKFSGDARSGAEVAETTVKRLHAAGFDALVKRWDKCISACG